MNDLKVLIPWIKDCLSPENYKEFKKEFDELASAILIEEKNYFYEGKNNEKISNQI
jgi:hypothetical protein